MKDSQIKRKDTRYKLGLQGLDRFFLSFLILLFVLDIWIFLKSDSLDLAYLLLNIGAYLLFWVVLKVRFAFEMDGPHSLLWLSRFIVFLTFFGNIFLYDILGGQIEWCCFFDNFVGVLLLGSYILGGFFLFWLVIYILQWSAKNDFFEDDKFCRERKDWRSKVLHVIFGFLLAGLIYFLYRKVLIFFLFTQAGMLVGLVNKFFIKLTEKESENKPEKVDILGVEIDNYDQEEAIDQIDNLIKQTDLGAGDELNLVVTPYSEYFIKARKAKEFREVLNGAQLSLPDGIFVLWAASFDRMPIKSKKPLIRAVKAVCRLLFSGLAVVLYPKFTRRVVKERVSGSELVYPLMEMAQKNQYRVFLLGGRDWGRGNAGSLAAKKLQKKYPKLDIVGVYPGERKSETREEALKEINSKRPDLLLVCFGGGSGETWMYRNKSELKAKVGIGLGGTFDFISGYAGKVPSFAGELGLEWLLRPLSKERGGLINNCKRAYRVWRGMIISSIILLIDKINFKRRK